MPLGLFRLRNVATANVVGVLWAAAMFAWFFISALYLQLVLGYNAMQVGLSFLPANLIMAAFSLGLSAKIVMRFGIARAARRLAAVRRGGPRAVRARAARRTLLIDVFPGMTLLGIGAGIAFNPLLLGAMSDVSPSDSGLASGVVNTAFMMGGALGLAVPREHRGGPDRDFELTSGVDASVGAQCRLSTRFHDRRDLRGGRRQSSAARSCVHAPRRSGTEQATALH